MAPGRILKSSAPPSVGCCCQSTGVGTSASTGSAGFTSSKSTCTGSSDSGCSATFRRSKRVWNGRYRADRQGIWRTCGLCLQIKHTWFGGPGPLVRHAGVVGDRASAVEAAVGRAAQGLIGGGLPEGLLGQQGIVGVGGKVELGTEQCAGVAELGTQEGCQRAAGMILGELGDRLLRLRGPVQTPPVPVDEDVGAERGGGRVGRLGGEHVNGMQVNQTSSTTQGRSTSCPAIHRPPTNPHEVLTRLCRSPALRADLTS